jgi:hypothetical protein
MMSDFLVFSCTSEKREKEAYGRDGNKRLVGQEETGHDDSDQEGYRLIIPKGLRRAQVRVGGVWE